MMPTDPTPGPEQHQIPSASGIPASAYAEPSVPPVARRSTLSKLLGLLLVVVCFEIGVFLVVFPWMDAWARNWIPSFSPVLVDLWESNYFRGALSGLGFINIWISFQEMLRLLRS